MHLSLQKLFRQYLSSQQQSICTSANTGSAGDCGGHKDTHNLAPQTHTQRDLERLASYRNTRLRVNGTIQTKDAVRLALANTLTMEQLATQTHKRGT